MSDVVISLPSGQTAPLAHDDATSLIDALWAVSPMVGAVVLVGKLRHALGSGSEVDVADDTEADAMLAALESARGLTPALEHLQKAVARVR